MRRFKNITISVGNSKVNEVPMTKRTTRAKKIYKAHASVNISTERQRDYDVMIEVMRKAAREYERLTGLKMSSDITWNLFGTVEVENQHH